MNLHLIEILYRGPTNTRGARVALVSHRFPADTITDGYDDATNAFEQGKRILQTLGFTITGEGETKAGYFCTVKEFCALKIARKAWQIKKGGAS